MTTSPTRSSPSLTRSSPIPTTSTDPDEVEPEPDEVEPEPDEVELETAPEMEAFCTAPPMPARLAWTTSVEAGWIWLV